MVNITDASFANEQKPAKVKLEERMFPRRSQKVRITCLAGPEMGHSDQAIMHIMGWSSNTIRRMCRSTFAAETQSMIGGAGEGM